MSFQTFKIFMSSFAVVLVYRVDIGNTVETFYCRQDYQPESDKYQANHTLPLLFMGRTWDTEYYITLPTYTDDYFYAALRICNQFGFQIASIKTPCQYHILRQWFLNNYPTDYAVWCGGFRIGNHIRPRWVAENEPVDLSELGVNIDYVGGPYFPGGYSPEAYPWPNGLTISRNCPVFTAAHQNPCTQTATYPSELLFSWDDFRSEHRVICSRPIPYSQQ